MTTSDQRPYLFELFGHKLGMFDLLATANLMLSTWIHSSLLGNATAFGGYSNGTRCFLRVYHSSRFVESTSAIYHSDLYYTVFTMVFTLIAGALFIVRNREIWFAGVYRKRDEDASEGP